jgi:hypothetical protein
MAVSKLKAAVWSLTSLREKLIKVVSRGRYVTFRIADVAASRRMFADILSFIARLRALPPGERAHTVGVPDQLHGSLPYFRPLKQAFRDLTSFCRALGGCSQPAAALEDGRRNVPVTICYE